MNAVGMNTELSTSVIAMTGPVISAVNSLTLSPALAAVLLRPHDAPPDRLEQKFRDCAAKALHAGAISRVYEILEKFETLGDVRELTTVMAESIKTGGRILEAA